ncbi:MAG: DUF1003 domain-containing protein [Stenotrophomonas sp.]
MSINSHLDFSALARSWFGANPNDLGATARRVLDLAEERRVMTQDPIERLENTDSKGDRLADRVAALGGSWTFILIFVTALFFWVLLNSGVFAGGALDPFPFIFLNLLLSMVAALQAPIIMMSQNRQASKDRQMAAYDYEINLKAEIEIMSLHEKMDSLKQDQVMLLIAQQQKQIDLLTSMIANSAAPAGPATA